ncbi:MAG: two-component regulator propeller domain-containing protein [bacterium]|nr:two-component regulator propeller domain-containing protein [bacterium]
MSKKIILIIIVLITAVTGIHAQEWLNLQKKDGLIDNYIRKITVYRDEVWIGTSSGISVYNKKEKTWKSYSKKDVLPDNFINDIFLDEQYLWIATAQGLVQYDKKNRTWNTFTKANGLPDNNITCIYADKENYWFGTRYWGVAVFSRSTRTWKIYTSLDGIAGNNINCISGGSGDIWFGTRDGLSQLKYYEFLWKIFTSANTEFGLKRDTILSLVIDGDDVWCGTEGEGISKLNKYLETWVQFNTGNNLLDDFIQTLALDGENMWVGTFSGISLYNKYRNTWQNFGERKELPDLSITTITVDGDYIWIGSAGGGITRMKKEKPQIEINHNLSGYAGRNLVQIFGTAIDQDGVQRITCSYKKRDDNKWFDTGIRTVNQTGLFNGLMAEWNTGDLEDGEYLVKIDVFDRKGNYNSTGTVFKIDSIKPILYLDNINPFVRADSINVTGTYFEDNLVKIYLKPSGQTASVDKVLKTFTVPVKLKEGENRFEVVAEDIARQASSVSVVMIKDSQAPKIEVDQKNSSISNMYYKLTGRFEEKFIDSIMVEPVHENAGIDYKNSTFSKVFKLNEGWNNLVLTARDKAGNETVVRKNVEFIPEKDPVLFRDFRKYTDRNQVSLNGEILFRNILDLSAELNQQKIPLAWDRNTYRFDLPLKLKEGKNYLSLDLRNREDKHFFMIKEIICDSQPPSLLFHDFTAYSRSPVVSVRGKFADENLSSIKILEYPGKEVALDQATGEFSVSLDLKENTRLTFSLEDKAGNKSMKRTNIIYDKDPPLFISLDYPRYTADRDQIIKVRFIEKNPDRVVLNTGRITSLEKDQFICSLTLREEKNDISLTLFDRTGFQVSTNFTVYLDEERPGLVLNELPSVVQTRVIRVKGEMKSSDIVRLTGYPGQVLLSMNKRSFSGDLPLQSGVNRIKVEAIDRAGNQSECTQTVVCQAAGMTGQAVTLSREEYEQLRNNRAAAPQTQETPEFQRESLPETSSLVLMPYYISRGDSLWQLSRDYYGNHVYADYIQNLNNLIDPGEIKARERIFLPTPKLIRSMTEIENGLFQQVLSLVTYIRYNYGYYSDMRKYTTYLETIFSNYGIQYKKLTSNYNRSIFFINNKDFFIFSRYALDLRVLKDLIQEVDKKNFDVIELKNDEDRISCDFYKDYQVK